MVSSRPQTSPVGILVCNRKGGVGKTTVSTNLAALYARRGWKTTLLDCDPQLSSLEWFDRRRCQDDLPLSVVDGHANNGLVAPAVSLRVPGDTECLIYDAPCRVHGYQFSDLLRRVRLVLVPILPSPIDMVASESFVKELLRAPEIRGGRAHVALIANRVREAQLSTQQLQRRFADWPVPLLAQLLDTQLYVYAAGLGRAAHELRGRRAAREQAVWDVLFSDIGKLCHLSREQQLDRLPHRPAVFSAQVN